MTNINGFWFIGDGVTKIQEWRLMSQVLSKNIAVPESGSSIEDESQRAIGKVAAIGCSLNKSDARMSRGEQPSTS